MEGRHVPALSARILVRSQQLSRLRLQLLAQAYQRVCPEIRQPLSSVNPSALTASQRRTQAAPAVGA